MRRAFVVAALVAGVPVGIAAAPDPAAVPPASNLGAATAVSPALPSDPSLGADGFERFQCSRCHAIGTGANRIGPNLGRLDLRMPFTDGVAELWNHLPGMDRQIEAAHIVRPRLTADDLLNLVAFYTTYQYYVTRVGRPGDPARGATLFREKLCVRCHAVQAAETSKAPNLSKYGGGRSVLELAQSMWNHGAKMQQRLENDVVPRPSFRAYEMADVLAYLATLGAPAGAATAYVDPGSPARGAAVFVARGCGRCHPVRGVGGLATTAPGEPRPPDLGRHDEIALKDYTEIAAQMWNHAVPMWGRMQRLGIPMQPLEGSDLADLVAYLFFANLAEQPGEPATGAALYAKQCAVCHGKEGAGQRELGVPALATAPELRTPWEIMAAMFRAAPVMEALTEARGMEWPTLAPGELRQLIAFLQQLRAGSSPEKR